MASSANSWEAPALESPEGVEPSLVVRMGLKGTPALMAGQSPHAMPMLPMIDERLRLARDLISGVIAAAAAALVAAAPSEHAGHAAADGGEDAPEGRGHPRRRQRGLEMKHCFEPSPSPVGECKSARAIRRASSEASRRGNPV